MAATEQTAATVVQPPVPMPGEHPTTVITTDPNDPDATILAGQNTEPAEPAATTVLPPTQGGLGGGLAAGTENKPLEQLVARTEAIPMPGGNAQPTRIMQTGSHAPSEPPVPMPRVVESENEAPVPMPGDGNGTGDFGNGANGGDGAGPLPPIKSGESPAGNTNPDNGNDGGRRKRIIIIAAMVVVALVIAAGIVVFGMNRRHDTALAACNDAQTALANADQSLKKSKTTAEEATKTKSSDVSDPQTIDNLKTLTTTNVGGSVDDTKSANACSPDLKANVLQQHADTLNRAADKRTELVTKLDDGTKAVRDGQSAKTVTTSRDTLQSTTDGAQQLMTSSNGKVADDSTRTDLKKAIDEALKLLDKYKDDSSWKSNPDGAAKEMTTSNDTVKSAMASVNKSVSAKQAADAKKKAAEEAKKRAEEQKKAEAAADKTRCASIAGRYGMWQGSVTLVVYASCGASTVDETGSNGWSGTYVPNSYQSGTWKLSNGKSLTYYPAGTTAPWIKQYMQSAGGGSGPNKPQIQTSDGTPYVKQ
ncbi:hypothetical protein [Bifidobacterium catulorum]|uniref:hypothetical protein n=1 Tax=Bifidobacterium catulorum TaxID=1630173 RepID=UPI0011B21A4B|nr:hypothetical protein [Bifidobacterium catulorum]